MATSLTETARVTALAVRNRTDSTTSPDVDAVTKHVAEPVPSEPDPNTDDPSRPTGFTELDATTPNSVQSSIWTRASFANAPGTAPMAAGSGSS